MSSEAKFMPDEGDWETIKMIRRLYTTRNHPDLRRLDMVDNMMVPEPRRSLRLLFVMPPEPIEFACSSDSETVVAIEEEPAGDSDA